MVFWDFEISPPDYVTINQNFSPIPQIYTPGTTILIKKNFRKIFKKKLRYVQNLKKNGFAGILRFYPLIM